MVTPPPGRRLWETLKSRTGLLRDWLTPPNPPRPGLYTYPLKTGPREGRLHLRVASDQSGILFLDVTEVIHLNPTAVWMVKLALEGVPQPQARAALLRHYGGVRRDQISRELQTMYRLAEGFQDRKDGCPTCALADLHRAPLFSTPVTAPFKADLALTYGCNNECSHCYNEPERFPMPSLGKNDWFRVIDRLHAAGVPHLILTGGEATLHPDLPEIIAYADGLGHIVGLNTNGRRLAHRPYLRTLIDAGLNHVQITLGSCFPDVHNAMMGARSFEQTVKGIQNTLDSPLHVITNTTLMQANRDHLDDLLQFLHQLGLRTFAMNGMIYSGGGTSHPDAIPEEEIAPLLIHVRDLADELGMRFLWYTPTEYCRLSPVELEIGAKRCNAGEYSLCIEPNGDVLPCQSFYVSAGNILRDPWEQIWNSDLFLSFRDREAHPAESGLPKKCWGCPDLPLCGGGCRIEREARLTTSSPGKTSGCVGTCRSQPRPNPITGRNAFVPVAGLVRTAHRGTGASLPVDLDSPFRP